MGEPLVSVLGVPFVCYKVHVEYNDVALEYFPKS